MKTETGKLYVVATPIGNVGDITLRAIEVLKKVDAVICEEFKAGSTLLKRLGIEGKQVVLLNEHNEAEQAAELLTRLINGQSLALISDCGTPVFADPGTYLIQLAAGSNVPVTPIPGASSIMAALSVLDQKFDRFIFTGFLPREAEKRRGELTGYRRFRLPLVIMDTPYRLSAVLEDISKVYGNKQWVTLAFDLTLPTEHVFRGEVGNVLHQVAHRKGEFVLVVHQ